MRMRHSGWTTVLILLGASSAWAGNCRLLQLGTLPVTLQGLRPTVRVGIDGRRATFLLDSGAFYSTICADTAVRYRLALHAIPGDEVYGRGLAELRLGERRRGAADLATAKHHYARIGAVFRHFGLVPASPTGTLK